MVFPGIWRTPPHHPPPTRCPFPNLLHWVYYNGKFQRTLASTSTLLSALACVVSTLLTPHHACTPTLPSTFLNKWVALEPWSPQCLLGYRPVAGQSSETAYLYIPTWSRNRQRGGSAHSRWSQVVRTRLLFVAYRWTSWKQCKSLPNISTCLVTLPPEIIVLQSFQDFQA